MLTDVCRWFIEGFDTPDLKDGKAFEGSALTSRQTACPIFRAKGRDAFGKSLAGFSAWPIDHSMNVANGVVESRDFLDRLSDAADIADRLFESRAQRKLE